MGGASVHNVSTGIPPQQLEYLQYVVGDHSMIQHKTSGSQTDSDQMMRRPMPMGQDHLDEPCLDDFP